ncbi:spherulation-specific family 4 protein, partial [Nitrososphaera sp.]|uniref:spherulation-specific family 4 protein n=1 Tax=Nitrososphaera sp. TaxID=1971748 RepID=UPI00307E9065
MSDGRVLSMYAEIRSGNTVVKSGFTPISYTGATGGTYVVTVWDYQNLVFDHWGNGSTGNPRTVSLNGDITATAYYRTGSASSSPTKNLTVNAHSASGGQLNMWTTIQSGGSTVRTGFTPLSFAGTTGATYTVTVSDYGSNTFGQWENGSTSRTRSVTLNSDVTATATYRSGSTPSPSLPPPPPPPTSGGGGITSLIPKTGAFVALYMYPGGSGDDHWQKVYDVKRAHPSVPIVAVFNPSSGPGYGDNSVISSWVDKLRSVGVIMLGYVYDDYGTRSPSALRADVDK